VKQKQDITAIPRDDNPRHSLSIYSQEVNHTLQTRAHPVQQRHYQQQSAQHSQHSMQSSIAQQQQIVARLVAREMLARNLELDEMEA